MIAKTRAVVLREIRFRNQSKICTLLTREFGKVTIILKGARNPKNRLCGKFSPGNVVEVILYKKNGREVQLAKEGCVLHSPLSATPDMERFAAMYSIVDLVSRIVDDEEKNIPLFSLLEETLAILYGTENRFELLLAWFYLHLVSRLGFEPSIFRCVCCGRTITEAIASMNLSELFFVMDPGGIAIPAETTGEAREIRRISTDTFRLLITIAETPASGLGCIVAEESDAALLCGLLQEYCARHLEYASHTERFGVMRRTLRKSPP